jgi:hypothetical protein
LVSIHGEEAWNGNGAESGKRRPMMISEQTPIEAESAWHVVEGA